jgi:hypothetical protein
MTEYIEHTAAPDAPGQTSQTSTVISRRDDGDEASIKDDHGDWKRAKFRISRFLASPRPPDRATLSVGAVFHAKRRLAFLQLATWRARTTLGGSLLFWPLRSFRKAN